MSISLVGHLFRREVSGGRFKAVLLWLLPYAYLSVFVGAISFSTIKLVEVDSLGPKAISLLLVLACGLSLIASYISIAKISGKPTLKTDNSTGTETSELLRVSWKLFEFICFTPIVILAGLSIVSFLRS